jgi:hypothetical protein
MSQFNLSTVKQLLIDSLVNEYITTVRKLLPPKERWVDVAQKARELGFEISWARCLRLSRHVNNHSEGRLTRRREERIRHGTTVLIWVYLDTKQLEETIQDFFNINCIKNKHYRKLK